jgi:hypothetical protein
MAAATKRVKKVTAPPPSHNAVGRRDLSDEILETTRRELLDAGKRR